MQIFSQIEDATSEHKTAIALGFFDGLHVGHRAVIDLALAQRENGLTPAVFTFSADANALGVRRREGLLLPCADKLHLLCKMGVELVLCPDFSALMQMDARDFVEGVLVGRLNAAFVCCGENFRFGRGAAAGVDELRQWCDELGVMVQSCGDVLTDGKRISSTWIRELLAAGEAEKAAKLLGRPFGYLLPVVVGKRLGRTIGSPTINQQLPEDFVPVRLGVYASAVRTPDGSWHAGVTNIGLRPTVEHSDTVNSETYIHAFSGDLYGQKVLVRLLRFLRGEKRFSSVEALRAQIAVDTAEALPVAQSYLDQTNHTRGC